MSVPQGGWAGRLGWIARWVQADLRVSLELIDDRVASPLLPQPEGKSANLGVRRNAMQCNAMQCNFRKTHNDEWRPARTHDCAGQTSADPSSFEDSAAAPVCGL